MPWIALNTKTPILAAAALVLSAATSSAQLPYGCPGGSYYDTHFGRCVPTSYSVEPSEGTGSIAPSNGSPQQPSRQSGTGNGTTGPANSNLGGRNGGETSGTTR